ncbi:YD repeat-containing protein [Pseudomonas amygdali pv. dendropanacis]|uniref:YD repeat-containing protein n=1 Tax=Pseudomonas amygdali pv. dendropanacis TaxID=235272 RepID=A0A0P9PTK1_PSEA0|nr:YD repeat-containing protein [Pseudomonas amygdali pv. dendropanacis]
MPVPSRQQSGVVNWPSLLSSRGWWGVNSGDYYETLNYGYDAARNLVQIGYPSSINLTYTRNSAAQVTGVRLAIGNKTATLASNISYLPFGPVNSLTWGNGILLSRTYDQDYQLTQQQVGNWQTTYRYDADSNISETATSLWGAVQYEYDALGRLTQEQTNSVKKAYSFDATGNRTQRTTTSLTTSDATDTQSLNYASDSNRLTSINGSTLPVDAAGNHTQINGRRFTYDSQGRLSEVYQANIYKIADYKYNALGQRIIKRAYVMGSQALAGTTTYLYDPNGKLIGQTFYDGNGQKTSGQYWFWLDNMPLAQLTANFSTLGEVSSSKLIYLHVDHLNTPRLATDSTQALLWRWNSDAYGVGSPEEDVDGDGKATSIALRFPGQIYDAQTQLSYNYYRDYNLDTGRYAQSDPIGLNGGFNTYGYVKGNPLSFVDPLGLETMVTVWQPVGFGSSSFGHVSTSINGTTYSWGPGGMTTLPTSEYLEKNGFRDGMAVGIDLTPQQEQDVKVCLSSDQGSYNVTQNNCGSPIQNCLQKVGVDTKNQLLPVSLGNRLLDMGVVKGIKEYPASRPATGRSAPWAK